MTNKRKILLLLLPLLMLACKTLLPEPAPKREPSIAPTRVARKTSAPRPAALTAEADSLTPESERFTLVRLEPKDGKLAALLAAEVQKAAALGQTPVAEFDAPW